LGAEVAPTAATVPPRTATHSAERGMRAIIARGC
jgi:hypothetical protein